jgi:hypothetical protein
MIESSITGTTRYSFGKGELRIVTENNKTTRVWRKLTIVAAINMEMTNLRKSPGDAESLSFIGEKKSNPMVSKPKEAPWIWKVREKPTVSTVRKGRLLPWKSENTELLV